jgi:hypothetical protein
MDTKFNFNMFDTLSGVPEFIKLFPVCTFVVADDNTKPQTLRRVILTVCLNQCNLPFKLPLLKNTINCLLHYVFDVVNGHISMR